MNTTYTFRTMPAEYRDVERWRAVELSQLEDGARERFLRLSRGLRLYVKTGRARKAAAEAGCSPSVLLKQLNRCLTAAVDGEPLGWRGLIQQTRLGQYKRRADLPQGELAAKVGAAGSFERFLEDHRPIRQAFEQWIVKPGCGTVRDAKPMLKNAFRTFLRLCERAGIDRNQYPLNSKTKGRRSVERYVRAFIARRPEHTVTAWFGEEAGNKLRLGTGHDNFAFANAPLDVAACDAHKLDCKGVICVNGPAGPQFVPIERLWLFFYGDWKSRAVLGYSASIRTEISATTVEEALACATREWKPKELTIPGLKYAPGAGLPVGTIEGFRFCRPCVIHFDNAAVHYADRISQKSRSHLGCAVRYGAIGNWWQDCVAERFFKTIEQMGFHRLPSSTGSGPQDPLRSDSVAAAKNHGISWEHLLELLDVLVANYNAEPHSALGHRSPLDVLRAHLHGPQPTFIPRPAAPPTLAVPPLGIAVERRPVRGSVELGRRPYIELDKDRYTGPELAMRFDLLGEVVTLHINESDMRSVTAYQDNGMPLGTLRASRAWRNTKHTRDMRKSINALRDAGELRVEADRDVVSDYLEVLASKAYRASLKRPKSVSRDGTKLANAVCGSGVPVPTAHMKAAARPVVTPARPLPMSLKQPVWRSR